MVKVFLNVQLVMDPESLSDPAKSPVSFHTT